MNKEKLRDRLNYAGSDKAEYEKIENEIYEHDRKRLEFYSVIENVELYIPLPNALKKVMNSLKEKE